MPTIIGFVDEAYVQQQFAEHWGGVVVSVGRTYTAADVIGLGLRFDDASPSALVTWAEHPDGVEIVTLNAFQSGKGYGRKLLHIAEQTLKVRGARRLLLHTTNDNLGAHSVYLREGWRLVAIYPNEMDRVRAIKPTVPLVGLHGIHLQDMWRFEKHLTK